jgi:hypothetical protein
MKLLVLLLFIGGSTVCFAQTYSDASQWKFDIIRKVIDSVTRIEQINLSDTGIETSHNIFVDYRDYKLSAHGDIAGWTVDNDYQNLYIDTLLYKKIKSCYRSINSLIECEDCFDQRFGLINHITNSLPPKGGQAREAQHALNILVDLPLYMEWTPIHILIFATAEKDNKREWLYSAGLIRYKTYRLYLPVSVVKNDLVKGNWINVCHQYLAEIKLSANDSFTHFNFELSKIQELNKW